MLFGKELRACLSAIPRRRSLVAQANAVRILNAEDHAIVRAQLMRGIAPRSERHPHRSEECA
jgi:hypothetical protein